MRKIFLASAALVAVLCAAHPAQAESMQYFKSTESTTAPIDTTNDSTAARSQETGEDQPLLKPAPKAEASPAETATSPDAAAAPAPAEDAGKNTGAADAGKDYQPYLTSPTMQKSAEAAASATNVPAAPALISRPPKLSPAVLPPQLPRPQAGAVPPEMPVPAPVAAAPDAPHESAAPAAAGTSPDEAASTAPAEAIATTPETAVQPSPPPEEAPAVPSLADLTLAFSGDSSELSLENQRKLANLLPQLKEMKDGHLQVRGFASDAKNNNSTAKRIALSRVLAVRSYFLDQKIPAKLIDVKVMGANTDRAPADRVDLLFESNP